MIKASGNEYNNIGSYQLPWQSRGGEFWVEVLEGLNGGFLERLIERENVEMLGGAPTGESRGG